MATTYSSNAVASGVQPRGGIGVQSITEVYEAEVALVVDDIIKMVKIPAGAEILDIRLSVDDLDTDGTPAIVLDVGDGDDDDRFILGTTIAQGGGTVRLGQGVVGAAAASCAGYRYTADDTIDVHVDTAPDAGGTGTISLTVIYSMQPAV